MITAWIIRWRRRKGAGPRASAAKALAVLVAGLAGVSGAHIAAMIGLEGMSAGDAAWVTATTLTTVGYGDLSAASASGRIATVALLYVGGIWILGKAVGDWFDIRAERAARRRNGRWRWKVDNHLLVVNSPKRGCERYFRRLADELAKSPWGKERGVIVLTTHWDEGVPAPLAERGVKHVSGRADNAGALERAGAKGAAAVLVLIEDLEDEHADALTFDTVHRLREQGITAPITAEAADDANRERLRRAGADTVLRALRGYPELTVRALAQPQTTEVLTQLFSAEGAMCARFEIDGAKRTWAALAAKTLEMHAASAIAYERSTDGAIVCAPRGDAEVHARAVIGVRQTGRGRV